MDATKWFLITVVTIIVLVGGVAMLTQTKDPEQAPHADNDEPVDDRITITDAVLDVNQSAGTMRLTITVTKPLPEAELICCELAGTVYAWGLPWTQLSEGVYTALSGLPTFNNDVWEHVYLSPSQPQHFISWPPQPTVNLH